MQLDEEGGTTGRSLLQANDLCDVGEEDVDAKLDTGANEGERLGGICIRGIAVEISLKFCEKDRNIKDGREEKTFRVEEGGVWMDRLGEEEADSWAEGAPEEGNYIQKPASRYGSGEWTEGDVDESRGRRRFRRGRWWVGRRI